MDNDALRTAHAYVYVAAAFALLAMVSTCITVGLFFGPDWGMATFTLFCVAAAVWGLVRAAAQVRLARKSSTE